MRPRLTVSFTLSVLLLSLLTVCKQNTRDYRGNIKAYESFMIDQSNILIKELFVTNCAVLNRHFLISDTTSSHSLNCLRLDTIRSRFTMDFQHTPANVQYTYTEIPGHITTKVARSMVHKLDTLKLSCWFFNAVDWNTKSFDSSSTTPVALELWYKNERVYRLHQHGY